MTKIDIFSGFLGAGKTTLIKKMISEAFQGEKVVLIENEFGEIGIDGGFLQDAGIEITEMNSGCICCSLVGDFGKALEKVLKELHPDRILIEPSGVGKLSDVIRAVRDLHNEDAKLNSFTTVADVNKCKMYMKNFGEFYNDQIGHAGCIVLSHTTNAPQSKIDTCVELLRQTNDSAVIVVTPWEQLTGKQLLEAMEQTDTLEAELAALAAEEDGDEECECHHHHHHDDDEECECHHHHHDDDDDEEEHEHHHHHDDECECHHHHHDDDDDEEEHEHHHHHDDECECHHHHHHHADDVFSSIGRETAKKFTKEEIIAALNALTDAETYGTVLRAKGIVPAADGSWIHFDYVPGEPDVRTGSAGIIGRLCIIGAKLDEEKLLALFGV